MAEYRQWRNEERTLLKDVVPLDTPYTLNIESSSLCNIRCKYCAHSVDNHGIWEGNMSMELFREVLHQLHGFPRKLKLVDMFCFGEPLCNPNLALMISEINKAGVAEKINFTTNGILFTHAKADEILSTGVDTIRISLQGLDADKYHEVCGARIDFEKFRENLLYLYENRGQCKIRMKIADVAIEDVANGKEKLEKLFGDRADSLYIEHILPKYEHVDYAGRFGELPHNAIEGREGVRQSEWHKVCYRPFIKMRIGADGAVTASCCDTPRDIRYGRVPENNIVELWQGGIHNNLLKMLLEGKRFEHPVCKTCILPNDIASEADILDPWADEILKRMK